MTENWLLVADEKNSKCDSAKLDELDWTHWYSDDFFAPIYLHVGRKSDISTHRVYPKKKRIVGLAFRSGKLHWIQGEDTGKKK